MTECTRIALADLTDYAAGELPDVDAAAVEEHLFSCPACGARGRVRGTCAHDPPGSGPLT